MSDLMKTARAIQDPHFEWRTTAAMFLQAQVVYADQAASTQAKQFAEWVLLNPGAKDPSMMALVASDPAVVDSITVTGEVPDTDKVPDADIKRVVKDRWSIVAKKYGRPA
jgi:hypothetical protein